MADLNIPQTKKEVVEKLQTDIKTELPALNPYLRNSNILTLAKGLGGRIYDVYRKLTQIIKQSFVVSATDEFLENLGIPYGIIRLSATKSTGNIIARGIAGSIIPINTTFKTSDGLQFKTLGSATITNDILSITTLTFSGGIATATTSTEHNLATGINGTITGAVETDYNINTDIVVISATQFTFEVAGSPSSPATGTILFTTNKSSIIVESVDFGSDTNQSAGVELTLLTAISGVDNSAFVQYDGLSGGADIETDEDLRARLIFRIQNPVANFNGNSIENEARKLAFVDRVWVQDITPAVGQVTIYFSNKDGSTPTVAEISLVKTQILTIRPAPTSEDDVIVSAPSLLTVSFTFSSLSPNTSAIQQAITANLTNFFATQAELGVDIAESEYISVIQNARDITSGLKVSSFTLSSPTGDITVASNELPVLGVINF